MRKIHRVEIKGSVVYLKKDFLGWHTISPIKNEDGSINWKNLIAGGSWWKLIILAFFLFIVYGLVKEYTGIVKIANDCLVKDQIKENISNFINITFKR